MTDVRKTFHQHLDEVRSEVVRLAALVTDTIPRGTAVLLDGDLDGAQSLIDSDDVLDQVALGVEEQCNGLLVLQQPMAGDLRAVLTALHLVADLERSGDLVVNIAKSSRRIPGAVFTPRLRGLIERMSEEAVRLCRAAVDAYVDEDAVQAAAIDEMDDTLDDLQSDLIEAMTEAHAEGLIDLQGAVQLALIARYYERIGDHAVNVGERVRYLVDGWMPEPTGTSDDAGVGTTAGIDPAP